MGNNKLNEFYLFRISIKTIDVNVSISSKFGFSFKFKFVFLCHSVIFFLMSEGTKDFRSRGELSFNEKGIFYMATGKSINQSINLLILKEKTITKVKWLLGPRSFASNGALIGIKCGFYAGRALSMGHYKYRDFGRSLL